MSGGEAATVTSPLPPAPPASPASLPPPSPAAPSSTGALRDATLHRIRNQEAVIGVIGLGYVGLPLVLHVTQAGFRVLGFDVEPERVAALNAGETYIRHCPAEAIREMVATGRFEATTDITRAREADALLICVPTPLTPQREPDLDAVRSTAEALAPHLRPGQLVVLESTTWPGTTNEVLRPLLEASGLKVGVDLFLAFCPEREDPGNPTYTTERIPRVVGGWDAASGEIAEAFYEQIVVRTLRVSSAQTAEAVKILENTFRAVNIALVNELKLIYSRLGIDIWEVIEAASTKPFGFMPFYPGPGIGGHCIPVDPFYLTWKAREIDLPTRFIELAGEVNRAMPFLTVDKVAAVLNERGRPVKGTPLLLVGLAYKPDVDDLRESPSLLIFDELRARGADVDYYDPYIAEVPPTRRHPALTGLRSIPWSAEALGRYELALVTTAHSNVDYRTLATVVPVVVDTRGACRGLDVGTIVGA